jgi:hypothetical protein
MKSIEDKIRKNRERFNDLEPEAGHFERFGEKLGQFHKEQHESWFERHSMILKIAAAFILFATFAVFLYTNRFDFVRNMLSDKLVAAELPVEVREVMQYYNVITDKKVEQIDELAVSEDEAGKIKEMALTELRELEKNREFLEQEYARNPSSERILNALMLNQQKRAEILDKIINKLNQIN